MLNKKLCQRCWLEWHNYKISVAYFEREWNSEFLLLCPCGASNLQIVDIKNDPPKECRYILEQILENNSHTTL